MPCYDTPFRAHQAGGHLSRRRLRVLGLGDRPHDDDPGRARGDDLAEPGVVDPADREPGPLGGVGGGGPDEVEAGRRAARLGRGRPAGAGAEVVDAGLDGAGPGLRDVVGGPPDQHVVAEDAPRDVDRQVVLPEVQHVGPRGQRHVGAVVDGEQRVVAAAGVREHLQRRQFVARLQPLLAQLQQVHPAAQGGVGELGEVAALAAGVGADVEPGAGEPLAAAGAEVGGGGRRGGHRTRR